MSISYKIVVPSDSVVVASTGSGSISVNDIAGSGRITVDGRQEGDWKIDTGSGRIRVE